MPYKSVKQERFFNANKAKMEKQGVDVNEWNAASKGMKLPTRVTPKAAVKIRAKAGKLMVLALLACSLPCWAAPKTIQVTIGASATQISTTKILCSSWMIQNNAAHNIRFGDSTVTSSIGTLLAGGTAPGGSYTSTGSTNGTQPVPDDLSQWYIAGTQNDVIDVTCKVVNF